MDNNITEYEKDNRGMIEALVTMLEIKGVLTHTEFAAILDIPVKKENEEEV